jgi:hypothetical protein
MRSPVYIRPYNPKTDQKQFAMWLYENRDKNNFDPAVFTNNQSKIFCAFDSDGVIAYFPVSVSLYYGALAPLPGVDDGRLARAMDALAHVLVYRAFEDGIADIFVQPNDERFADFLRKQGNFRDAKQPVLQLHLNDLLKKSEKTAEQDSTTENPSGPQDK